MTLGGEFPACRPSLVQEVDPRWKLAGLLAAALLLLTLRTSGPALLGLAGALTLAGVARIPWGWYAGRLAAALTMYVLFLVWLPLVPQPGDATWDLGLITISQPGLFRLLVSSAKLASMISLALVMLATTPLHDVFKAARALGLPRLLVLLLLLTTRYVFLLMEEFARLRIALRVRGFRNRADLHSYRTIGQVAGTLLVRSQERSERVGQAMRCRGFDGEWRTLHTFHTSSLDLAAFAVTVGFAAALAVWDWIR